MKIGELNGYTFHVPTSGGKAGKGCNVTSSLQVRKGYYVIKQFRFTLADADSRTKAIQKAKDFVQDIDVYATGHAGNRLVMKIAPSVAGFNIIRIGASGELHGFDRGGKTLKQTKEIAESILTSQRYENVTFSR